MITNSQRYVHETRMQALPRDARREATRAAQSLLQGLVEMLQRMRLRARLRRDLERLDEHLLHDIGIKREELETEATKPFWQR